MQMHSTPPWCVGREEHTAADAQHTKWDAAASASSVVPNEVEKSPAEFPRYESRWNSLFFMFRRVFAVRAAGCEDRRTADGQRGHGGTGGQESSQG